MDHLAPHAGERAGEVSFTKEDDLHHLRILGSEEISRIGHGVPKLIREIDTCYSQGSRRALSVGLGDGRRPEGPLVSE